MRFKICTLTAICLFALLTNTIYAQKFNLTWSNENSKAIADYNEAIQLGNGNYIVIKSGDPRAFLLNNGASDPTLVLVDPNMKLLKEVKFQINEKNAMNWQLRKYGNTVFFLYTTYSKESKSSSQYAIRIDQQTLMAGQKTILGSFDSDDMLDQFGFITKLSPDSSKLLVFAEGPYRQKENEKYYIGVFDTTLKKIWGRNIEQPINDRFVAIYDWDINNEGKVFVAFKQYDKKLLPPMLREEYGNMSSYKYKLFTYSKENPGKEISFDLKDYFIEGTKLVFGKNGSMSLAGLYKKKHNGNITGLFYSVLDSSALVVSNPLVIPVPQDILDGLDKGDWGEKDGSDPGISRHLRVQHILPRQNGTVDLISEVQETTTEKGRAAYEGTTTRYNYGDIINININKEGRAIFTRVPKFQMGVHQNWALSYFPVMYGDKLVLLYNDHEDNMTKELSKKPERFYLPKKAVLAAATIDANGNLSRQAIYNYTEEKKMALPTDFSRISDTKYLVVSTSPSFLSRIMGFGLLEIK